MCLNGRFGLLFSSFDLNHFQLINFVCGQDGWVCSNWANLHVISGINGDADLFKLK